MMLGVGWLGFYPQDKSTPLTFTSPMQSELTGSKSAVSNAHTLGLSFSYFLDSNWAVEAVLGIPPKFKLDGRGTLAAIGRLGEASQYSPTILARYNFLDSRAALRPFVSVGGTYVWYDDIKLTQTLQNAVGGRLGQAPGTSGTSAKIDGKFAPVLNAGVQYRIDDRWGVSFSLSYVKLKTKAKLTTRSNASGATVGTAESGLTLDPIVSYLSVNYRF